MVMMVVTIITMTMIMIKDIYNNTNSDDKGCHSSSNSSLL
jgi:hypothetical protein